MFRKVVAGAMAVLLLLTGCAAPNESTQKTLNRQDAIPLNLSGKELVSVADNGTLELLCNPATTEMAVRDKKTGSLWYTNPQARGEDSLANAANAALLSSQFVLNFADSNNQISEVNSYDLAVKNNQFSYYQLENGIKVDYLLQQKAEITYMPEAVTAKDFEENILPRFPKKSDQKTVKESYGKIVMAEVSGERQQKLLEQYAAAGEQEVIYVLYSSIANLKKKKLSTLFEKAGFTEEEKNAFEESMGINHAEADKWFTVSMEYTLEDDTLLVHIPAEDIRAGDGYLVTNIAVLPFFGAGHQKDEGFLLVPDGSGAIVDFADSPQFKGPMSFPYYGADYSMIMLTDPGMVPKLRLPVFGIKSGEQGFLGILEEGAALGSLQLNLAGRVNQFNSLHVQYDVHKSAEIDVKGISNSNTVRVYQDKAYEGGYSTRYAFFTGKETSYSHMANYYRERLLKNEQLPTAAAEKYPFYTELLCAINKTMPVAGIPVDQLIPLTSFTEAESLLSSLEAAGISDRTVQLTGWNKGGVRGSLPNAVRPEGALGGKKGLESFITTNESKGIDTYLDWNGSYFNSQRNGMFDSFVTTFHNSKSISQKTAWKREYSVSSSYPAFDEYWWNVYTPDYKRKLADGFQKAFQKLPEAAGIAASWEGFDLNADYNTGNQFTRMEALKNDQSILSDFSADRKLLVKGTNAYGLPYADFISGVPMTSSGMDFYSHDIPFYQMVVHGSVNYATENLNFSTMDEETMLLKLIETGSSPAYLWISEGDQTLKTSDFNSWYSLEAATWMEQATQLYREAEAVLKPLAGQQIVSHEPVGENAYRITYSNQTKIYVNYSSEPVRADGITVEPSSYLVKPQA